MITPDEVRHRNMNIQPYIKQIDHTLGSPWTEEMKAKGRRVSLRLPHSVASDSRVLCDPSDEQLASLEHAYRASGWVFKPDTKGESPAWVFEYPKGKKP